jgi:hypothetical protein
MPKTLAVLYCFPRSGGTLLNQCLLCAKNNVVLSEINPAGSVIEPEIQAADWFELITSHTARQLKYKIYQEKICTIHSKCEATGRKLCVRDWSGINFLPNVSSWAPAPSLALEQRIYLQEAGFELREVVLLRRSKAVFHSIRIHIPKMQQLSAKAFAEGYRAYLEQTKDMARFYLEELTQPRAKIVQKICSALSLDFDAGFEKRFYRVQTATGNITLPNLPASAHWKSIHKEIKTQSPLLMDSQKTVAIFDELDALAGYNI